MTIETALVYIHSASDESKFFGCGAIVEGGYVVTCRHVWRDAIGQGADSSTPVLVALPFVPDENGEAQKFFARLTSLCEDMPPAPDLVLLSSDGEITLAALPLPIARDEEHETGDAYIHAFLYSRGTEVRIAGVIDRFKDRKGRRRITGGNGADYKYWLEHGSSGSPVFMKSGMQLAGIVSLSELGATAQSGELREAFVVPGSTVWRHVSVAKAKSVPGSETIPAWELRDLLAQFGKENVPASEIPASLRESFDAMRAYASQPVEPAGNEGDDISQTVAAARREVDRLNTGAALEIIKARREEERQRRIDSVNREIALLREQAEIEKLAHDYGAAKQTLWEIVRVGDGDFPALVELGDLEVISGTVAAALTAYEAALTGARARNEEPNIAIALNRVGDVLVSRNDLEGALEHYREGLHISRQLMAADPSHAERARDVSVSLDRIGEVLVSRNDLEGALKNYQEGLDISRRLMAADPSHAERARDVSVSVNKIGDVLLSRNDLEGALKNYQEGLDIRRRLMAADPSHAERARDVSVSLERIGDVLRSRNDLEGALKNYQEGLDISRRLMAADRSHAERARDVSVSVNKIGDVLLSRNDLEGALKNYQEGLDISRRLMAADPSHAERARDVSVSLERIGDVLRSRNDLEGALKNYQEGLDIRRRLMAADPSHAERARDVSVSLEGIGDVLLSRNDLEGALKNYQEGLDIRRRLMAADPSHAERARDVSVSLERIGDVLLSRNDLEGALKNYQEGLDISRRLMAADPSHAGRARDVAMSLLRIGDVEAAREAGAAACGYFREARDMIAALARQAPDVHVYTSDLAWLDARIAEHCGK